MGAQTRTSRTATDSTYTLVAADAGKTIKVRVAFTDRGGYSESLTGGETATVAPRPNRPATGAPTINGTAEVGEILTANTSGIVDADGLTRVSFSYQWISNDGSSDTDITGATDSTYTLVAADEGKAIEVRVAFTDDAGNDETLTSAATDEVSFAVQPQTANDPATGEPVITGTAQVGETLTADTSGISDADGLAGPAFAYQWLADDAEIASANEGTYVLTSNEMDKTIKVRVSFTDDGGNEETLTSSATEVVSPAVQQQQSSNTLATGAPTISGTAQVGETLTADTSDIADADGLSGATFTYQWIANDGSADTDIQDATDSTYTLVADDEGKTVKVRVSFTDDAGTVETLTSTATNSVAARPNSAATGAPTINGTVQVGETLTADTSGIGDADGLNNVSYSYQWVANDGTSDTDITDATDSTYTLAAADEGRTVKVNVSFTDDAGNEETLTSAATGAVAGAVAAAPSSYITVAVTEDSSDSDNIVTNFTVTWSDSDDCSTNYNIYLAVSPSGNEAEISRTHLGSAASGSTQATPAISFRGQPFPPNPGTVLRRIRRWFKPKRSRCVD